MKDKKTQYFLLSLIVAFIEAVRSRSLLAIQTVYLKDKQESTISIAKNFQVQDYHVTFTYRNKPCSCYSMTIDILVFQIRCFIVNLLTIIISGFTEMRRLIMLLTKA